MTAESAPLSLAQIDLEELATVLDHSEGGFFDPADGETYLCIEGEALGPDGDSVDPDELGWYRVGPIESHDGYRDMETFARAVTDPRTSDRLWIALDGTGAFRRFRNVMYDAPEELGRLWNRYHDVRVKQQALEWLVGEEFVVEAEGRAALTAMTALATHILDLAESWKATSD